MRIDSKHNIECEEFYDKIEQIVISPLCEEFGETHWMSDDDFNELKLNDESNDYDIEYYDNYEDWMNEFFSYPRLSISGYHWGLIVNMKTSEIG